jgi:hypothetical protein
LKTLRDVEMQVQEKLSRALKELDFLPRGYRCSVRLRGRSKEKSRSASFEKSWSPDTDSISITFERISESKQQTAQSGAAGLEALGQGGANSNVTASERIVDLVRALDRAESRPGYSFVVLKWFRDTALPLEDFPWARSDSARQSTLAEAIDKRMILLNKIANPRSPQFPVTTIRLNRLLREVQSILGKRARGGADFEPVPIRGENLSETILRDRR